MDKPCPGARRIADSDHAASLHGRAPAQSAGLLTRGNSVLRAF
jgi:hypothetical protein